VRPVGGADQPPDCEAKRGEHLAHLAVLPLAQRERDPAVHAGAVLWIQHRLDRPVAHAVDAQPLAQVVETGLADQAADAGAITAHDAARRQLHLPRQGAVVGEQEQALGAEVEPAYGDHPPHAFWQALEHRRAPLRVAVGGHQPDRLVVAPEPSRLGRRDRLAVDGEHVGRADLHRRRRQDRAVQADPSGGDQPLDLATRRHAGARQGLGDPLGRGLTGRARDGWV